MSCSSESAGMKPAMLPEKPSFAQTCNLLRQYLKEKGSFGDISLGMTCNVETNETPRVLPTTMNLFPVVDDKSGDVCSRTVGARRNLRSMELFPQGAGLSAPAPKDDVQRRVECSVTNTKKSEPQTAQMTIFYGGQVVSFSDFPADKAKEIMLLASKSSSQTDNVNPTLFTSSRTTSPIESSFGVPPISKSVQPAQRPVPGDLPIARRASLHRFLEKRKDRITTKAPYLITSSAASPSKSGDSKSWLGLAAPSP
ncbi:putative polygalacturonase-like [Hibiscus syriacus]|uniref:Protein TIFY n=1 Tax=Hibiscus syriacus TaxID=106335 RepID=A0A6A2YI79_HIBSY|nr:protein TIFY 10A-like [Hibiscus syriacus]KAE8675977.1 putative polygalacturonase-like [Hibiscus syriacus]